MTHATQGPRLAESALIVRVVEAEPHVLHLRAIHDPVASLGVPAHITVLYPFVAPAAITTDVCEAVRRAIADIPAFRFHLTEVRQFPGVLYLAPEPAAPFATMTAAIASAFPAHPPYGGRFASIVPHLTVAHCEPPALPALEAELRNVLAELGPIPCHCREIELIENTTGLWRLRQIFALASS